MGAPLPPPVRTATELRAKMKDKHRPDDDDDEVQDVPAGAQIGARMKDEAVGDHLHEGFQREDHHEHVLQQLLYSQSLPIVNVAAYRLVSCAKMTYRPAKRYAPPTAVRLRHIEGAAT